jgi:hypothetical protein
MSVWAKTARRLFMVVGLYGTLMTSIPSWCWALSLALTALWSTSSADPCCLCIESHLGPRSDVNIRRERRLYFSIFESPPLRKLPDVYRSAHCAASTTKASPHFLVTIAQTALVVAAQRSSSVPADRLIICWTQVISEIMFPVALHLLGTDSVVIWSLVVESLD